MPAIFRIPEVVNFAGVGYLIAHSRKEMMQTLRTPDGEHANAKGLEAVCRNDSQRRSAKTVASASLETKVARRIAALTPANEAGA
jgi:hypothetical protein